MPALLNLFVILLQYTLTVYCIRQRKFTGLILLQIFSLFTYDFIFINASYRLPGLLVAVLKLYNEYLLFYFIFHFFFILKRRFSLANRIDALVFVLIIFPALAVLLLNDLTRSIHLSDTLRGLRIYLLPVLLPYIMYRCDVFKAYRPAKVINALFGFSLLLGIYGCLQRFFFTGHVRALWFYTFFDQFPLNPVAYQPANFIRNDVLRVTGIFVSPLTYSITLAIPVLIACSLLLSAGRQVARNTKIMLALFMLFLLYCQWTSVTRIAFIIDAMGLAALIYFKLRRTSFLLLLCLPLAVIGITFFTLLAGMTKDLSALGRLIQYRDFFRHFSITGLGFNNRLVLTNFDSYYLSIGLLYGTLVSFPLLWLYHINRHAWLIFRGNDTPLNAAFLALSIAFIYTFAFQFIAGSAPYKLYFLLLFLVFAHERSGSDGAIKTDPYRIIPKKLS